MRVKAIKSPNNITVEQWQSLIGLGFGETNYLIDFDNACDALSIVYNLSGEQIGALPNETFKKLRDSLYVLYNSVSHKKIEVISANGNYYKPIYDIEKFPDASKVALKLKYLPFKNLCEMTPYLVARMVLPLKKNLFCFKEQPHQIKNIDIYIEDIKKAPAGIIMSVFVVNIISILEDAKQKYHQTFLQNIAPDHDLHLEKMLEFDSIIETIKRL